MKYDDIVRSLEDRTLTVVSERTGIHRNTLAKIATEGRARRATLELLSRYLDGTAYEPDEGAQ